MLGVIKLVTPVPPANTAPPVDVEYQSMVDPVGGVAEIVTTPAPHLDPAVPIGAVGNAFTTAVTTVLVADTHVAVRDST